MKLQRKLHAGLAGCLLALAGWIGAPLQAQQAALGPEAGAPAEATLQKGPLPQDVAEQVRKIVMALVKARLPPAEEGTVEIARFAPPDDKGDNNGTLNATVDGQTYSAEVFRPFLVEPLNPNEFYAMKEFYVRTTRTPWKLKAGVVIPAETYLSGNYDRVGAYDKEMIVAQNTAIATSETLCQEALAQVGPLRKDLTAKIAEAHKADMDALTKRIKQLQDDINKMQATREQVVDRVNKSIPRQSNQQNPTNPSNLLIVPPTPPSQPNQTPRVTSGKDANGNLLWEWNGSGVTFYDNLDQSRQELDEAYAGQKKLQAKINVEVSAAVRQCSAKERDLRAILQNHRKRILGGEPISEEDMRAEYEAALGSPLNAPPASGKPNPADAKPPIRATPAQKRGT